MSQNTADKYGNWLLFYQHKILRYMWPLCPLLIATLAWIGALTLLRPITSAMTRRNLYQ